MLRAELVKAREYQRKQAIADPAKHPDRDLKLEMLSRVLRREVPLLITANRAQDIASALAPRGGVRGPHRARFRERGVRADRRDPEGGCASDRPPEHAARGGETDNQSFETAAGAARRGDPGRDAERLRGLRAEDASRAVRGRDHRRQRTELERRAGHDHARRRPALGIDDRVGTLEPGKDGDVALYDGDPFEYTTHCTGTVISGEIVGGASRKPNDREWGLERQEVSGPRSAGRLRLGLRDGATGVPRTRRCASTWRATARPTGTSRADSRVTATSS